MNRRDSANLAVASAVTPMNAPSDALHRGNYGGSLESLVCEFNLKLGRYVDPSWLPDDWPPAYRMRAGLSMAAQDVVTPWLMHWHGLRGYFWTDFSLPEHRLALLGREALQRMAIHYALAMHRGLIRKMIDKCSVERLVARIGRDAYDFTLFVVPELTLPGSGGSLNLESTQLENDLLMQGSRYVLAIFDSNWRALRDRVRLKLPRQAADAPLVVLDDPAQRAAIRNLMTCCIIPEVLPEWDWLFSF